MDEPLREELRKRIAHPKNFKIRNPSFFKDNQVEVDRKEILNAIKNDIKILEYTASLNPENEELRKLYEFAKKHQE